LTTSRRALSQLANTTLDAEDQAAADKVVAGDMKPHEKRAEAVEVEGTAEARSKLTFTSGDGKPLVYKRGRLILV